MKMTAYVLFMFALIALNLYIAHNSQPDYRYIPLAGAAFILGLVVATIIAKIANS
jgi:hypothetical protein